ncbi:hypothetical protein QUB60_16240 [Microcoleus sp. A2-C5]|uniref:hypothetical protein n=1 Tax=Microcoleus sp. A2-C2 TaxID=2818530 RepID=UPI002FD6C361
MSIRCLAKVFNLYGSGLGQYQISTYAQARLLIFGYHLVFPVEAGLLRPPPFFPGFPDLVGDRPHLTLCD